RPVSKLEARMDPAFKAGFSLDMIPAFGHMYTLANTQPVNSGEYQLQITGRSVDGGISAMMRVLLSVRLPVESAVILPVAPYIPEGFVGSFPLTIQMLDSLERPNQRPVAFSAVCGGMKYEGTTGPDGRTGIVIPLDGTERNSIVVDVSAEGKSVGTMPLAVKAAGETFILGRVGSGRTGSGIDRLTVVAENRQSAMTNPDGYFFLSLPLRAMNMKLSINPITGYLPAEFRIKTDGMTAQQPQIVLAPRSPALLGRHIAIIAERGQDEWARPIVRSLMQAGAFVRRLPVGSGAHPEYDAVATANFEGGFDLLVALKPASGKVFELRHYHSSTSGKRLANAVVSNFCGSRKKCGIQANAGSDYELGHTAAAALVICTPQSYEKDLP
ncbi:MAG TPA: hypothetical protein PKM25_19500, partial [Candidatus Ozemobacteraceae bacterium]|nr:hypothetical protein [Candidatus Ozemobacteraceae bacterium]